MERSSKSLHATVQALKPKEIYSRMQHITTITDNSQFLKRAPSDKPPGSRKKIPPKTLPKPKIAACTAVHENVLKAKPTPSTPNKMDTLSGGREDAQMFSKCSSTVSTTGAPKVDNALRLGEQYYDEVEPDQPVHHSRRDLSPTSDDPLIRNLSIHHRYNGVNERQHASSFVPPPPPPPLPDLGRVATVKFRVKPHTPQNRKKATLQPEDTDLMAQLTSSASFRRQKYRNGDNREPCEQSTCTCTHEVTAPAKQEAELSLTKSIPVHMNTTSHKTIENPAFSLSSNSFQIGTKLYDNLDAGCSSQRNEASLSSEPLYRNSSEVLSGRPNTSSFLSISSDTSTSGESCDSVQLSFGQHAPNQSSDEIQNFVPAQQECITDSMYDGFNPQLHTTIVHEPVYHVTQLLASSLAKRYISQNFDGSYELCELTVTGTAFAIRTLWRCPGFRSEVATHIPINKIKDWLQYEDELEVGVSSRVLGGPTLYFKLEPDGKGKIAKFSSAFSTMTTKE